MKAEKASGDWQLSATGLNSLSDTHIRKDLKGSAEKPRRRIFYALGPGDVVGLYRDLLEGRQPAFQLSMAHSKQFLDWCDTSGADAQVVSWHARQDCIQVGRYQVENRPKPSWSFSGGLKYHIGSVAYGLALVARSVKYRPTVVIVDAGTSHWIVFSLLTLLQIPIIAVMHNTLWPMGIPPTNLVTRFFLSLDKLFFRHIAAATVCVSPECERQVRKIAVRPRGPIYQCSAQYRENFLSCVKPVQQLPFRPFHVLYMGRIEELKGVFLILSIAERLQQDVPNRFVWKIVGSGTAYEDLELQIAARNLRHIVELRGRLQDEESSLDVLSWCHAMIVPTRSRFSEGFAMTAAEAVLAGRPVVVSTTVPAAEVLGKAAIRAETDSIESFAHAFRRLASDSDYYESCQHATSAAQAQFYDRSQGLGAVLGRAISNLI
jgi:glycogen synthase